MSRWGGNAVIILASGPSLTTDDCDFVRWLRDARDDVRVIALNTTFRAAPWADVVYGCDYGWWKEYLHEVLAASRAELWTQDPLAAASYGLRYIESHRGAGLTRRPGLIYQGMNSGHQAIGLAASWGASKIILLGYDMQQTAGKSHWHGDHPPGLKKIPPFNLWIEHLEKLAADLQHDGITTINASRETALRCFPRMSLEAACVS